MGLRVVKRKHTNLKASYEQSVVLLLFLPLALCESQRLCVSASNCYLLSAFAPLRPIAIAAIPGLFPCQ